MDLQAFIIRGQVLSLMRKALRAARQAPPESRAEIRAEIRRSFETSRHHDDSRTIKHLLSERAHPRQAAQGDGGLDHVKPGG